MMKPLTSTGKIDRNGRIILLKAHRQHLKLNLGDTIQIESDGEKIILIPITGDKEE